VVEGPLHVQVTAYYACQFSALRLLCNCDERSFIEALSRCRPWTPTGGKSGSVFLKTQNDRFVLKAISRTELESFLAIAPSYFAYVARGVMQDQPSLLLRLYGVYSLSMKRGGESLVKLDVCVMENLFYNRNVSQIFDLKGSMRSRYVEADARLAGRVLLDENLVEMASRNPLLVSEGAKQRLVSGVHRDTEFLARHNVMDYSLLVGLDASRRLVVGIVDYIRQYTWDKQMETWLKRSAGRGPDPTVISPNDYKERFRSAMDRYFVMVPTKFTYVQATPTAAIVPRQAGETVEQDARS
jgi:1-phosphatidylinositol-3-phosphate 5-kinase